MAKDMHNIQIQEMDFARGILDNLMGRDRNLPRNSTQIRDHYSNSDVCKPYLICFCFNTLFPNTVFDEGPCNKRHDTYLKTMFDSDLSRSQHERQYIRESWIERRLQDVEQKTKKNLSTIQNKTSLSTERPRQILDRILSIDKDIEEMMHQAAVYGENLQIDDSARCLEEVERLREHRKEVDLMGDNLLAVVKHQKICEVCGAIQTINDTEKRISMHLQGKIHQGFLRLRSEIQTLRVRLQIVQQKIDQEREKNKQLAILQGEVPVPEVKVQKMVSEKVEEKEKQQHRQKQKDKPERDRSHSKKNKKQHKEHKEHKDHKEHKEHRHKEDRDRSRDKKKKRSFDRGSVDRHDQKHHKKQKKKKDRESHDKQHRRHYD